MLTPAFGSMSPFLAFAADVLVKSTVLLALVALASHLLRRQSAALRHLLWTLAIVGIVAMPVFTSIMPFRLGVLPARAPAPSVGRMEEPAVPIAPITDVAKGAASIPSEGEGGTSGTTPSAPIGLATVLLIVWLAGSLVLLARFAFGLAIVGRIARRATEVTDEGWHRIADRAARSHDVRSTVEVRRSSDVAMPFACGLITPVIVLPAAADEWTTERRDAVLMHEFAHISRGDLAMNTLSHFARALYWFHPLAWLAAYRLRVEGERACDDAVLRAGALPSDYAEHLLSIVRTVGNTVPNAALAMARRSDFEGRLLAILEPGVPRGKLTRVRAAGMAALFLIAVMPLAAMAPTRSAAPEARTAEEPGSQPLGSPVTSPTRTVASLGTPSTRDAELSVLRIQDPAQRQQRRITVAWENANISEVLAQFATFSGRTIVPAKGLTGRITAEITDRPWDTAMRAILNANGFEAKEDENGIIVVSTLDALTARAERFSAEQGTVAPSGAVTALIETLADANAAVRMAAINSLAQLQDPRAIAALAKALREDSDARVREAAAKALGEIDDSRAVAPLLEALKTERVASVKAKIVEALGEIDDPSAVAGIAAVVKDPSVSVRRAAVAALGELEDPSALSALMSMVRDEDAEVRKHVAEALGQLQNNSSIDALTTLAKDAHHDVRVHAISALGQLEDQRTLGTLVAALKDENADVRNHAADAIQNIDGLTTAPPALIEALRDASRDVRKSVAHALGNIGDPAAVPALKRAATDGDTEVRRSAVEALKEIGGPEAITALMGMLKDPDPEIRRIAAEALGSKRH